MRRCDQRRSTRAMINCRGARSYGSCAHVETIFALDVNAPLKVDAFAPGLPGRDHASAHPARRNHRRAPPQQARGRLPGKSALYPQPRRRARQLPGHAGPRLYAPWCEPGQRDPQARAPLAGQDAGLRQQPLERFTAGRNGVAGRAGAARHRTFDRARPATKASLPCPHQQRPRRPSVAVVLRLPAMPLGKFGLCVCLPMGWLGLRRGSSPFPACRDATFR